jgi:transcriptional regulator with XRE-family HTH domain
MADGAPGTREHAVPPLAELVRGWRERALLTQEQLASRAGLGVRTIRRHESSDPTRPRACSINLLADALNLRSEDRAQFLAAADSG